VPLRRTHRLRLAAVGAASLSLVACGGGEGTETGRETTSPEAVEETAAAAPAGETVSAKPEIGAEEPQETEGPGAAPKVGELTGFGATREAWESVRGESVPGFADGAAYGRKVRAGTYEYFAVVEYDLMTYYSRAFPEGTDLESAKQIVLEDFPEDAEIIVEDRDDPLCLIVLIESEQVRAVTGHAAAAGFFSEDDYFRQSDVSDATVFSYPDKVGPDLGTC
jgi:hypothetical protein